MNAGGAVGGGGGGGGSDLMQVISVVFDSHVSLSSKLKSLQAVVKDYRQKETQTSKAIKVSGVSGKMKMAQDLLSRLV